jgi:carnosine N-methyltransferase
MQGKDEREASYRPIKEALLEHFSDIPMHERYVRPGPSSYQLVPLSIKSRNNFRVLVPGAGLGRLAYDVAKLGRVPQFCASTSVTDSFARLYLPGK